MTISKETRDGTLTVTVSGRLDTLTAPELEKQLSLSMPSADKLVLDLTDLAYISSAGLRAVLSAHKAMSGKGGMKIVGVNDLVREVFDVTGFSKIFTIE